MSKNVYHIGSGALTFEIIERIINENLKLELAPEAKLRIQKCRDYLDHKIASSEEPLYNDKIYVFSYIIAKTVYTYLSHDPTHLHQHNHPTGTMNVLSMSLSF